MKPRLSFPLAVAAAFVIGACAAGEGDDTGTAVTSGPARRDDRHRGHDGDCGQQRHRRHDRHAGRGTGVAGTTGNVGSAGTTGGGGTSGLLIDGMCRPICSAAAIDPEGDGWGWEQATQVSCVVGGSALAATGSPCTPSAPGREGAAARRERPAPPARPARPAARARGTAGAEHRRQRGTAGTAGRGGTPARRARPPARRHRRQHRRHRRPEQRRGLQLRERAEHRLGQLRERRPQPEHEHVPDDLPEHLQRGRPHRSAGGSTPTASSTPGYD